VWNAYQSLSTCRNIGFGAAGPIPWTAINDYAYRHDIYGDEFDRLVHLVGVLDRLYLSSEAEKRNNKGVKKRRARGAKPDCQDMTPP